MSFLRSIHRERYNAIEFVLAIYAGSLFPTNSFAAAGLWFVGSFTLNVIVAVIINRKSEA